MEYIGDDVVDLLALYFLCEEHPSLKHSEEGITIFADPVSNTTENSWGGLPIVIEPTYSVLYKKE